MRAKRKASVSLYIFVHVQYSEGGDRMLDYGNGEYEIGARSGRDKYYVDMCRRAMAVPAVRLNVDKT